MISSFSPSPFHPECRVILMSGLVKRFVSLRQRGEVERSQVLMRAMIRALLALLDSSPASGAMPKTYAVRLGSGEVVRVVAWCETDARAVAQEAYPGEEIKEVTESVL